MGFFKCNELAKQLEAKIQSLGDMKSKILALRSNPDRGRIYMKRLSDRTHEFLKTVPSFTRAYSYDIEKGNGTLFKFVVNDLLIEMAYGTKSPYINLQGVDQGWKFLQDMKMSSWLDIWSTRYSTYGPGQHSTSSWLDLPVGVEQPLVFKPPHEVF